MRQIFMLLLLFPVLAFAEVYKCKENGKTSYSRTPCATGSILAAYGAKRASVNEDSAVSTAQSCALKSWRLLLCSL